MTGPTDERITAIEQWFDRRGLPYFVDNHADAVERWLASWRITVGLVIFALAGVGVAVVLAALGGEPALATTLGIAVFVLLVALYAGRFLRMGTMVRWAARRTLGSLGLMFPLLTRALPLLLLAVTFLFINAEVWQVAALMSRPILWSAVAFFAAIAVAFLSVRLPDEVRRVEREATGERLAQACVGTPADGVDHPETLRPAALARFARSNLVLVLLFSQVIQVVLLAVALFAFFVVFGALTIPDETIQAWTGRPVTELPSALGAYIPVTNELWQVAVFLAAFSGLYFTVCAVTDETYRSQFFAGLAHELEQAVAVNSVYLSLTERSHG
jgi:hypothetical protein